MQLIRFSIYEIKRYPIGLLKMHNILPGYGVKFVNIKCRLLKLSLFEYHLLCGCESWPAMNTFHEYSSASTCTLFNA